MNKIQIIILQDSNFKTKVTKKNFQQSIINHVEILALEYMMHQKLMYANYNMIQQSKLLNTHIIEQFGILTLKTLLSILEPKYLQQIAT
jgi:hypothetical protein